MKTAKSSRLAVVYKEDVAEAFGCGTQRAIEIMKQTGKVVMIGKRKALYVSDFYSLLTSAAADEICYR